MFELIDHREFGGLHVFLRKESDQFVVWVTARPDDETAGASAAYPTLAEALADFQETVAVLLAGEAANV